MAITVAQQESIEAVLALLEQPEAGRPADYANALNNAIRALRTNGWDAADFQQILIRFANVPLNFTQNPGGMPTLWLRHLCQSLSGDQISHCLGIIRRNGNEGAAEHRELLIATRARKLAIESVLRLLNQSEADRPEDYADALDSAIRALDTNNWDTIDFQEALIRFASLPLNFTQNSEDAAAHEPTLLLRRLCQTLTSKQILDCTHRALQAGGAPEHIIHLLKTGALKRRGDWSEAQQLASLVALVNNDEAPSAAIIATLSHLAAQLCNNNEDKLAVLNTIITSPHADLRSAVLASNPWPNGDIATVWEQTEATFTRLTQLAVGKHGVVRTRLIASCVAFLTALRPTVNPPEGIAGTTLLNNIQAHITNAGVEGNHDLMVALQTVIGPVRTVETFQRLVARRSLEAANPIDGLDRLIIRSLSDPSTLATEHPQALVEEAIKLAEFAGDADMGSVIDVDDPRTNARATAQAILNAVASANATDFLSPIATDNTPLEPEQLTALRNLIQALQTSASTGDNAAKTQAANAIALVLKRHPMLILPATSTDPTRPSLSPLAYVSAFATNSAAATPALLDAFHTYVDSMDGAQQLIPMLQQATSIQANREGALVDGATLSQAHADRIIVELMADLDIRDLVFLTTQQLTVIAHAYIEKGTNDTAKQALKRDVFGAAMDLMIADGTPAILDTNRAKALALLQDGHILSDTSLSPDDDTHIDRLMALIGHIQTTRDADPIKAQKIAAILSRYPALIIPRNNDTPSPLAYVAQHLPEGESKTRTLSVIIDGFAQYPYTEDTEATFAQACAANDGPLMRVASWAQSHTSGLSSHLIEAIAYRLGAHISREQVHNLMSTKIAAGHPESALILFKVSLTRPQPGLLSLSAPTPHRRLEVPQDALVWVCAYIDFTDGYAVRAPRPDGAEKNHWMAFATETARDIISLNPTRKAEILSLAIDGGNGRPGAALALLATSPWPNTPDALALFDRLLAYVNTQRPPSDILVNHLDAFARFLMTPTDERTAETCQAARHHIYTKALEPGLQHPIAGRLTGLVDAFAPRVPASAATALDPNELMRLVEELTHLSDDSLERIELLGGRAILAAQALNQQVAGTSVTEGKNAIFAAAMQLAAVGHPAHTELAQILLTEALATKLTAASTSGTAQALPEPVISAATLPTTATQQEALHTFLATPPATTNLAALEKRQTAVLQQYPELLVPAHIGSPSPLHSLRNQANVQDIVTRYQQIITPASPASPAQQLQQAQQLFEAAEVLCAHPKALSGATPVFESQIIALYQQGFNLQQQALAELHASSSEVPSYPAIAPTRNLLRLLYNLAIKNNAGSHRLLIQLLNRYPHFSIEGVGLPHINQYRKGIHAALTRAQGVQDPAQRAEAQLAAITCFANTSTLQDIQILVRDHRLSHAEALRLASIVAVRDFPEAQANEIHTLLHILYEKTATAEAAASSKDTAPSTSASRIVIHSPEEARLRKAILESDIETLRALTAAHQGIHQLNYPDTTLLHIAVETYLAKASGNENSPEALKALAVLEHLASLTGENQADFNAVNDSELTAYDLAVGQHAFGAAIAIARHLPAHPETTTDIADPNAPLNSLLLKLSGASETRSWSLAQALIGRLADPAFDLKHYAAHQLSEARIEDGSIALTITNLIADIVDAPNTDLTAALTALNALLKVCPAYAETQEMRDTLVDLFRIDRFDLLTTLYQTAAFDVETPITDRGGPILGSALFLAIHKLFDLVDAQTSSQTGHISEDITQCVHLIVALSSKIDSSKHEPEIQNTRMTDLLDLQAVMRLASSLPLASSVIVPQLKTAMVQLLRCIDAPVFATRINAIRSAEERRDRLETLFSYAVEAGRADLVEYIQNALGNSTSILTEDVNGTTMLHLAAKAGDNATIDALLASLPAASRQQAMVKPDHHGHTMLDYAILGAAEAGPSHSARYREVCHRLFQTLPHILQADTVAHCLPLALSKHDIPLAVFVLANSGPGIHLASTLRDALVRQLQTARPGTPDASKALETAAWIIEETTIPFEQACLAIETYLDGLPAPSRGVPDPRIAAADRLYGALSLRPDFHGEAAAIYRTDREIPEAVQKLYQRLQQPVRDTDIPAGVAPTEREQWKAERRDTNQFLLASLAQLYPALTKTATATASSTTQLETQLNEAESLIQANRSLGARTERRLTTTLHKAATQLEALAAQHKTLQTKLTHLEANTPRLSQELHRQASLLATRHNEATTPDEQARIEDQQQYVQDQIRVLGETLQQTKAECHELEQSLYHASQQATSLAFALNARKPKPAAAAIAVQIAEQGYAHLGRLAITTANSYTLSPQEQQHITDLWFMCFTQIIEHLKANPQAGIPDESRMQLNGLIRVYPAVLYQTREGKTALDLVAKALPTNRYLTDTLAILTTSTIEQARLTPGQSVDVINAHANAAMIALERAQTVDPTRKIAYLNYAEVCYERIETLIKQGERSSHTERNNTEPNKALRTLWAQKLSAYHLRDIRVLAYLYPKLLAHKNAQGHTALQSVCLSHASSQAIIHREDCIDFLVQNPTLTTDELKKTLSLLIDTKDKRHHVTLTKLLWTAPIMTEALLDSVIDYAKSVQRNHPALAVLEEQGLRTHVQGVARRAANPLTQNSALSSHQRIAHHVQSAISREATPAAASPTVITDQQQLKALFDGLKPDDTPNITYNIVSQVLPAPTTAQNLELQQRYEVKASGQPSQEMTLNATLNTQNHHLGIVVTGRDANSPEAHALLAAAFRKQALSLLMQNKRNSQDEVIPDSSMTEAQTNTLSFVGVVHSLKYKNKEELASMFKAFIEAKILVICTKEERQMIRDALPANELNPLLTQYGRMIEAYEGHRSNTEKLPLAAQHLAAHIRKATTASEYAITPAILSDFTRPAPIPTSTPSIPTPPPPGTPSGRGRETQHADEATRRHQEALQMEEARRQAEEEARRQTETEATRRRQPAQQTADARRAQEAALQAAEARRQAEEEARRAAEAEAARRQAEATRRRQPAQQTADARRAQEAALQAAEARRQAEQAEAEATHRRAHPAPSDSPMPPSSPARNALLAQIKREDSRSNLRQSTSAQPEPKAPSRDTGLFSSDTLAQKATARRDAMHEGEAISARTIRETLSDDDYVTDKDEAATQLELLRVNGDIDQETYIQQLLAVQNDRTNGLNETQKEWLAYAIEKARRDQQEDQGNNTPSRTQPRTGR